MIGPIVLTCHAIGRPYGRAWMDLARLGHRRVYVLVEAAEA